LTPVANLPPVSLTPVVHLDLWISPRIFEKIWNELILLSGAWGKVIHEKNQKQKLSWHCRFKPIFTLHLLLLSSLKSLEYIRKRTYCSGHIQEVLCMLQLSNTNWAYVGPRVGQALPPPSPLSPCP
jgi:hypothetical protein